MLNFVKYRENPENLMQTHFLSSINQHEAMLFIFRTQKRTTSIVMMVHVVHEETQRKSISGVSMNPQHIPAKLCRFITSN